MCAQVSIRVPKFLTAGAIASGVNLAMLYVATEWFGVWYLFSSFCAYLASFVTNFALQDRWVFTNHGSANTTFKFIAFLLNAVFDVAANLILLHLLVEMFHLHYMVSQALIIGALSIKNFLVYQNVIFKSTTR